jgi:hypothetical protein
MLHQPEGHRDPLCWRQTWYCPVRMFMHVHVTYRTVRLLDRRRLTHWPFVPRHAIHLVFQRVFSLGCRRASNTTILTGVPEYVWAKIQYERVSRVSLSRDIYVEDSLGVLRGMYCTYDFNYHAQGN